MSAKNQPTPSAGRSPQNPAARSRRQRRQPRAAVQIPRAPPNRVFPVARAMPQRTQWPAPTRAPLVNRPRRSPSTSPIQNALHAKITGYFPAAIKANHQRILMSITCPLTSPPVRLAGPFSCKRSAVASPYDIYPASLLNGSTITNGQQMVATEFAAMLFRDPRRAYIIYDANQAAAVWTYQFQQILSNNGALTATFLIVAGLYIDVSFYALGQVGYAPHGLGQIPGTFEGVNFVWIDTGVSATGATFGTSINSLGGTGAATAMNVSIVKYQGQQSFAVASFNVTVSAGAFQFYLTGSGAVGGTSLGSGYYAFYVNSITGGAFTTTSLYASSNCSVFSHLQQPGFQLNWAAVDNHRSNAACAMFTNTTNLLERGGQIAGYQSPGGREWTDQLKVGSIAGQVAVFPTVSKANGARVFEAKNGIYGFLLPSDNAELTYRDVGGELGPGATAATIVPGPFDLSDASDFLIILASIPNVAGDQGGYFSMGWGIEYETDDIWRSLDLPTDSPADFMDCYAMAARIPQWHENPLHLSDIMAAVKGVTGVVSAVAPIASAFFPAAAPAINAVGALSGLFGQMAT
jgi:hypothetical protein